MHRIGFFQFNPQFGHVEDNLAHVLAALQAVDADLIVLPELALTGYSFADRQETVSLAEDPRHSPAVDALIDLCRARDLCLITGFAERAGDRCYNSALLLGPGACCTPIASCTSLAPKRTALTRATPRFRYTTCAACG